MSVLEDGEALRVQLSLVLLPLARIKLLQSLVPQNFELLVGLLQLKFHVLLIGLVALAHCELVVSFVPLCVPSDRIQLTRVVLEVVLVVFAGAQCTLALIVCDQRPCLLQTRLVI